MPGVKTYITLVTGPILTLRLDTDHIQIATIYISQGCPIWGGMGGTPPHGALKHR